ncbi:hypothetical protein F5879DRAFT_657486 [Lentinula edodes]|nr:hypothetical protein F5879DRAFT_657486 [Lentinula edodes]
MDIMDDDELSEERISEIFRSADADIVIRSFDNVIFQMHQCNLECVADRFLQDDETSEDWLLSLPESGAVLEVLFRFVYPRPLPDLEKLEFEELLLVAEAAEKYRFFSAKYACQLALRKYCSSHSMQILRFACKHHVYSLITHLPQSFLIDTPLMEVSEILPSHVHQFWGGYREHWLELLHDVMLRSIPSQIFDHDTSCEGVNVPSSKIVLQIVRDVDRPSSLLSPRLDQIFEKRFLHACGCCRRFLSEWKNVIKTEVAGMPPFVIPE